MARHEEYFGAVSSFPDTKSFLFDGVDENINIPDQPEYSFGDSFNDSPFSLSLWLKVPVLSANVSVFGKTGPSGLEYDCILTTGGQMFFRIIDNVIGVRRGRFTAAGASTVNTWENWIFTYNGVGGSTAQNGMSIYKNNVAVDVSDEVNAIYVAMHNTTQPVRIGVNSFNQFYEGNGSNYAIWNKELSVAERNEIYNAGCPANLASHSAVANLVGGWRAQDAAFPTVPDQQGLQDGTMTNMEAGDIVIDSPCP